MRPQMIVDGRAGFRYGEDGDGHMRGSNQFSHARAFPQAEFKAVVRPNVDRFHSSAHLDLGPEPLVLSVPATDRYFMLPLLNRWTDVFAVPGTRITGRSTAREFLLVGPNWQGQAPAGLEIIRGASSGLPSMILRDRVKRPNWHGREWRSADHHDRARCRG
jgi:hypothetical protein